MGSRQDVVGHILGRCVCMNKNVGYIKCPWSGNPSSTSLGGAAVTDNLNFDGNFSLKVWCRQKAFIIKSGHTVYENTKENSSFLSKFGIIVLPISSRRYDILHIMGIGQKGIGGFWVLL